MHHNLFSIGAAEAAKLLNVSRAHFYRMHDAGRIPLPVRFGGAVRWRVDELHGLGQSIGMPNRPGVARSQGGRDEDGPRRNALEAEAALLGSIILDSSVLHEVEGILQGAEDFYLANHSCHLYRLCLPCTLPGGKG